MLLQQGHGTITKDAAVDVLHGQVVAEGMAAMGRGGPDYEFYFYEDGTHNPATMPGHETRVDAKLCALTE